MTITTHFSFGYSFWNTAEFDNWTWPWIYESFTGQRTSSSQNERLNLTGLLIVFGGRSCDHFHARRLFVLVEIRIWRRRLCRNAGTWTALNWNKSGCGRLGWATSLMRRTCKRRRHRETNKNPSYRIPNFLLLRLSTWALSLLIIAIRCWLR